MGQIQALRVQKVDGWYVAKSEISWPFLNSTCSPSTRVENKDGVKLDHVMSFMS